MSLPIYQRVAVTDAGDVIPGAEYTVINENTGVAAPIYSDRTGATLLSAPYFADSVGTIQFYIAAGTTFRVAASGGVGTYTDRYIYAAHPQSSPTDTTANALMAVGAFGLGTNQAPIIADADSLTASGMYRVGVAWTGSPLAGTSTVNQGYLTNKPWFGSSYFLQEFTNLNGAVFTTKWRRKDAGVWSDWYEVITADANGNVGSNIYTDAQYLGGFGAVSTAGTLDWNDVTNARSGSGYTLLLGSAANGPGGNAYYHTFSYEYASKDGSGNMAQLAFGYNTNKQYQRFRFVGTWSSWGQVL